MSRALGIDRIVGGHFALFNGDMHNLVQAVNIPNRKDVRLAGAHLRIDDDATALCVHAGVVQPQPVGVGTSSQRLQDNFSRDALLFAAVRKVGHLQPIDRFKTVQLRTRIDSHTFGAQARFQRTRQIFVSGRQHVVAALNKMHLGANALVKLRQFQRNGSAAQHQHGGRLIAQRKRFVAGDIADVVEAGNGHVANARTGRYDKALALDRLVADPNPVGR